jgi:hypothetical protein
MFQSVNFIVNESLAFPGMPHIRDIAGLSLCLGLNIELSRDSFAVRDSFESI